MVIIDADNQRINIDSVETERKRGRAGAIAPVLRMCYAMAAAGREDDGYLTNCGATASTVIYLGDMQDIPSEAKQSLYKVTPGSNSDDVASDFFSKSDIAALKARLGAECAKRGRGAPLPVYIEGIGIFVCGRDISEALCEAVRIVPGSGIKNHNVAPPGCVSLGSRLEGKIALVTGAAQGFGRGIAEELAAEGAYVAVADLNFDGAKACAAELTQKYGAGRAIAVAANVADEASVAAMVRETVLSFGGLDLFISNAGVLIAGALPDMNKEQFELVTSVNYTGYFLGVKHASVPMKLQRSVCDSYMTDIIEINSKSGLEGSNKNFAYAGSKFGGIGLTQSFALELVEYGIKVNAVCPGNFLDGPLWSDPVKGLFKQYLDAGKVPGAATVEDVRRYYESRVPMKRGCTGKDVAKAIYYLVEQEYETGQALPVTGGQVMLS